MRLHERARQLTDEGIISLVIMRTKKKRDVAAAAAAGAPETNKDAADTVARARSLNAAALCAPQQPHRAPFMGIAPQPLAGHSLL